MCEDAADTPHSCALNKIYRDYDAGRGMFEDEAVIHWQSLQTQAMAKGMQQTCDMSV